MIQAQLADGRVLEFPDGTDPQVVQATVKRMISGDTQSRAAPEQQAMSPQPEAQAQPPAVDLSGISDNATRYLQGVRSDRPMAERLERFNQNIAQGMPEQTALQQAAFGFDSSGEAISQLGRGVAGVPEAALTVATGAAGEAVGGLAGLGASLTPGLKEGAGARTVESVRNALTFEPRSDAGKGALQEVGEAVRPLEGIAEIPRKAGEFTQDLTGSPMAATAVETGLSAIPELTAGKFGVSKVRNLQNNKQLFDVETSLPTKDLQKALDNRGLDIGALIDSPENLPVFARGKTPQEIVDNILIEKIKRGDSSDGLYNLKVQGQKLVQDPVGEEALKQGYLKGDIAAAKSANRATKDEMLKMLKMKRQIESDQSKALDFRPTNVVGENAMTRFNYIRNRAASLRNELDRVAEKELGFDSTRLEGPGFGGQLKGREIDASIVSDRYLQGLSDLDVSVDSSVFPPKLDFSKSLISEDKTSQRIIRSVTNILAKDGAPDALAAHKLKRQLDTMLDFNKKSSAGLTEAGEKFAKSIRRSLNESVREVSPRYADINDRLSMSIEAMNEFDKALGGVDAFADNAPAAVGQTLRRLLSNAASRANLDEALINLDNVSSKLGGNFETDIKKLILFNKTLDSRFKATARGSFQGEIESALSSGPEQAAKSFAFKKAAEKIEDLRGINDTNAFNVMQRILSQ